MLNNGKLVKKGLTVGRKLAIIVNVVASDGHKIATNDSERSLKTIQRESHFEIKKSDSRE